VKILLVRVSSLGDVLHNLPVVADILRHHPAAQIDWVVEESYVSLVRLNPHVRKVIPIGLRRWRKNLRDAAVRAEVRGFFRDLRAERYDYVFDTQGLLKTGLIMALARVRPEGQKVGLANGTEDSGYEGISRIFHTRSIPVALRTHAVARGRQVVADTLGYPPDYVATTPPDFGMDFRAAAAAPRPDWMPDGDYIVFFHGTARDAKRWAPEHWMRLGRALAPMPILLPWGSGREKEDAALLAAALPQARVLPRLSMMDAVELAQRARLAVGVDTGLTHIAAAAGTPTIELYTDSPRWKTEGNWSPRIVNLGDAGAPPGVDEVLAAATALLAL
jgi:heptosyltransferase-1